jgi:hypothetical protein
MLGEGLIAKKDGGEEANGSQRPRYQRLLWRASRIMRTMPELAISTKAFCHVDALITVLLAA